MTFLYRFKPPQFPELLFFFLNVTVTWHYNKRKREPPLFHKCKLHKWSASLASFWTSPFWTFEKCWHRCECTTVRWSRSWWCCRHQWPSPGNAGQIPTKSCHWWMVYTEASLTFGSVHAFVLPHLVLINAVDQTSCSSQKRVSRVLIPKVLQTLSTQARSCPTTCFWMEKGKQSTHNNLCSCCLQNSFLNGTSPTLKLFLKVWRKVSSKAHVINAPTMIWLY